ncbi:MAG: nucleotidyltransferase domain-containing protein [Candidatus Woesearchaeota archaeon]
MEFNVRKKESHFHKNYDQDELKIARDFTRKLYEELGEFVKSVVLFGSHAKKFHGEQGGSKKSDIDILVIINDLTLEITKESSEAYHLITQKHANEISDKLHVTTLAFTNFWDLVRNGDPIVINILRDGFPIIDTGVFEPLQTLLYQGRIRPSWESVWAYYSRAPQTLHNAQWHIMQGVLDLYWAALDSAHAALMTNGEIPPSPSHVGDLLEKLYRKGKIQQKYVSIFRNLYHLAKHIKRREIHTISGTDYDKHYKDAKDFVDTMRKLIK